MAQKVSIALLSDATVSEIAFGMENQEEDYVFCLNDGNVYSCESLGEYFENPDEMEFENLPKWSSADGYRLMCAFAQTCSDNKLKKKLTEALSSGSRGIFKRFRAVLDATPGATEAWYKFKDKRMSAYIRSWFRKIQAKGSSKVAVPSEEDSAGTLMVSYDVEHLEALNKACRELEERILENRAVERKVLSAFTNQEAFCAYKDGLCGMIAFEVLREVAVVTLYYIEEKSRGLGLFEMLFDLMNRELERRGVKKVQLLLPADSKLENFLADRGVKSSLGYSVREYQVEDWNGNVESQEIAYLV